MNSDNPEYEKILFRFYSDVLDQEVVETLWAFVVDKSKGLYKIDNMPFYAPDIASDDIVYAETDEDEDNRLAYRYTVEPSGNSIVTVIVMKDEVEVGGVREQFKNLGCLSEGTGTQYFAMEIPANVDYAVIRKKLELMEQAGTLGFAEPCLSDVHASTIKP